MSEHNQCPIGFFDSGVGGLSVLKKAMELMPNENYIYFGDSKNAPYGGKSTEEVRVLTFNAMEFFVKQRVKAVVIACNTATSAAVSSLREEYKNIPIIGIEPALKPAVAMHREGKILIMATSVTLKEKKFQELVKNYGETACIVSIPCPGLVEYIERGDLESTELQDYLINKLKDYKNDKISSIVLGCTHYPFIKDKIQKIVGNDVIIIDGSEGTARELKRKLQGLGILNNSKNMGSLKIYNSLNKEEIINLSYKLLGIKK
ncbi:glutamate racemase [Clostridium amylolyticum]|uniref:Glutamate racemase n=2 Tax=Clostridium amylolyticum TaxID=1121298 RepID=A0A1M6EPJ1_9CLOT|nr:glutamate racemase [Clostridium amylolyticum]SHI87268.1 glutamate racemase [Clostridium amylolyticum]